MHAGRGCPPHPPRVGALLLALLLGYVLSISLLSPLLINTLILNLHTHTTPTHTDDATTSPSYASPIPGGRRKRKGGGAGAESSSGVGSAATTTVEERFAKATRRLLHTPSLASLGADAGKETTPLSTLHGGEQHHIFPSSSQHTGALVDGGTEHTPGGRSYHTHHQQQRQLSPRTRLRNWRARAHGGGGNSGGGGGSATSSSYFLHAADERLDRLARSTESRVGGVVEEG